MASVEACEFKPTLALNQGAAPLPKERGPQAGYPLGTISGLIFLAQRI